MTKSVLPLMLHIKKNPPTVYSRFREYPIGGFRYLIVQFLLTARTEQRDLQTIYTNVRKMLGLDDDRKTTHTVDKGLD